MIRKLSADTFYIGADDKNLDLFESQYIVPDGISYNSYVVIDDKVAILDTIDERKADEWEQNLSEALGERVPESGGSPSGARPFGIDCPRDGKISVRHHRGERQGNPDDTAVFRKH